MAHFAEKDLRILYVASLCLFYFVTFQTEIYDELVGDCKKYPDKETLLEYFYTILANRDENYGRLVGYLEKEANDYLICGISSISRLTDSQFASNLLLEIEILKRPFVKSKPAATMPIDF